MSNGLGKPFATTKGDIVFRATVATGHVHMEMALENHSSCHRCEVSRLDVDTILLYGDVSELIAELFRLVTVTLLPHYYFINIDSRQHRIVPALYHAFNDSHIRFG